MRRWKYESDAERFWTKVEKGDGCWEWTASKDGRGYGVFWMRGATSPWKASRVSWVLAHGAIPSGLFVLHTCDNPGCVRPDHLFLGTPADNTADMCSKGRSNGGFKLTPPIGELNYKAKLAVSDVVEIRRLYAIGYITQKQLARMYGVGQNHISRIVRGEAWSHAPEGY